MSHQTIFIFSSFVIILYVDCIVIRFHNDFFPTSLYHKNNIYCIYIYILSIVSLLKKYTYLNTGRNYFVVKFKYLYNVSKQHKIDQLVL